MNQPSVQPSHDRPSAPPQGGALKAFDNRLARMGALAGKLFYAIDRRHRKIVETNLAFTHPEWPPHIIQQTARRVFENAGKTFFEIIQAFFFSRDRIASAIKIKGLDNLHELKAADAGAIAISAHFGNWELGLLSLSGFIDASIFSVARPIEIPTIDQWLYKFRTRFGNQIVNKKNALRPLMKAIGNGRIIGIMLDQEPKHKDGAECVFFGKKVSTTSVAALLARRYEVPVFPLFCVREKDGTLSLCVRPRLQLQKTENASEDLKVNAQQMTTAIEDAVRAYPDQWFWFHKRWKKHYPHLYKDLAARQRRRERKKQAKHAETERVS